ncbi:OmpA/MotB domain protein [Leptonema illini DSM 21528]|uniref:OmpA/MotB domain protein n=2 Tax=Leptonema illini TaxID=183 RepID=H2CJ07_9LEPT|nr:OmpA/MotB domain protein [Leptonema illini DSM 21528]
MMKRTITGATLLIFSAGAFSSCDTMQKYKKTIIATGVGCAIGLGAGAIYDEAQRKKDSKDRRNDVFAIFKKKKSQNQGKIVGLGVGCLAGLGVGLYLDLMYDDMSNQFGGRGIQLEKVKDENGETEELLVKMDGDINFAVNQATLAGTAKSNVANLKEALAGYPETGVRIWGHTDKSGQRAYNEALSLNRARTVQGELALPSNRVIETKGYAWDKPLDGTGASPTNRRVEVRIVPAN